VYFDEVLAAAHSGKALLPPEVAGYLALAVADLLVRAPRAIDERVCALNDDGSVSVADGRSPAGSPIEAERSVRSLLGRLLSVASGATPALTATAQRRPEIGIAGLLSELEAALIPVNRAAARRALSRLAREALRAREEGLSPLPVGASAPPAAPPRPHKPLPPRPQRPLSEPAKVPAANADPSVDPALFAEPAAAPGDAPAAVATPIADEPEEEEDTEPIAVPPRHEGAADARGESAAPRASRSPGADDLVANFIVGGPQSEREIARELKQMAGLDPTPAPEARVAPRQPDGQDGGGPSNASEVAAEPKANDDLDDDAPDFRGGKGRSRAGLVFMVLVAGAVVALFLLRDRVGFLRALGH
jgi:hypothetical protein